MHVFKVATNIDRSKNEAELYLYGYIGQDKYWEDDLTEPLTDLEVVRVLRQLEQEVNRINLRINSPGGSVHHGAAIISAIQSCKVPVHTYVDGMAGSMAADIFLSCPNRHMNKTSMLMVHSISGAVYGNAVKLRKYADTLDTFDSVYIANMATITGKSEEEIRTNFYDGEDHYLSAQMCKDYGIIQEVEDYTGVPVDPSMQKLTHAELLQAWDQLMPKKSSSTWGMIGSTIFKFIFGEPASEPVKLIESAPYSQTTNAMQIDELRTSLADGTLKAEEVQKLLQELEPNQQPVDQPDLKKQIMTEVNELLKTALAQPGATRTLIASAQGDDTGMKKSDLDLFNEMMTAAASNRESIHFTH